MKWTPKAPPTENVSHYDHTMLDTPLGTIIIEWKSWKRDPDYGVEVKDTGTYIGTSYSLAEAVIKERFPHLYQSVESMSDMRINDLFAKNSPDYKIRPQ